MYKSSIEMACETLRIEQENNLLKAVQNVGINVDKDELIRALQYDRKQYDEGYYNGYRAFANKFHVAFREHYPMYKDDALIRMGDVVRLITDVKNEVYENDNTNNQKNCSNHSTG